MPGKQLPASQRWPRVNAYLTPEQIEWINRTRGQYMVDTGESIGATDLVRIALFELQKKKWSELSRLIERYGRRARQPE